MPLTPIQRNVLHLLAAQRHIGSHLAGGAAINRGNASPRFSADIDFFHDVADQVYIASEADALVLSQNGYAIEWQLRQPYMHRARIQKGDDELKLEWCYDSAFRFFPVQPDSELGFVLHPADLAANKILALAGRSEIRDLLDILYLHETYLSLGAICWAACGKDPGFNPTSLLDFAKRQTKFREPDLVREQLVRPISLANLKTSWLTAVAQAEQLIQCLPATEMGCLYLTPALSPITPDPADPNFPSLIRHYGSIQGAWPTLA